MTEKSSEKSVTLLSLVEHPGGPDGGKFAQRDKFGVNADGSLYYECSTPDNDSFNEHKVSEFVAASSREWALAALTGELSEVREHLRRLESLVEVFSEDRPFSVSVDGVAYDAERHAELRLAEHFDD